MVFKLYTDAPKSEYLSWFVDALSLAQHYGQELNYLYFKETCSRLHILEEIEQIIRTRTNNG